MARHTVGLEPGDKFDYRILHTAVGKSAHVDVDGLTIIADDPDQLERYAETCMEAARDLRIVEVESLGSLVDDDNTAAAMDYIREQKAARRAELDDAATEAILRGDVA